MMPTRRLSTQSRQVQVCPSSWTAEAFRYKVSTENPQNECEAGGGRGCEGDQSTATEQEEERRADTIRIIGGSGASAEYDPAAAITC